MRERIRFRLSVLRVLPYGRRLFALGLVLQLLAGLMRGRRSCPVVVADGRIVERGPHDELVARGGVYADLFALQATAYA